MPLSPHQESAPSRASVLWILWFASLTGLIAMQMTVGGGIPAGPDATKPETIHRLLPIGLATGALIIRFFVIPRFKELREKLPLMLVGLALAEAAGIYGFIAIDPSAGTTRLTVFLFSILCILASAPVYATAGIPGSGLR